MSNNNGTLERQKAYVEKLDEGNFKYGLTVGAAFVRGIRDIGYKHTGTALDELIDNSFEAGAENVHVMLRDDASGRKNQVSQMVVIDDGVGMIPGMIRAGMVWGGTDRLNSRSGLGRFGFGLPSACVSQGKRFEVYSKSEGGATYRCELDLEDIEAGKYTAVDGQIVIPKVVKANLPRYVEEHIEKYFPGGKWNRGTIVVIDKLDKPTWKTLGALQNKLLEHFGVTYHKLRGQLSLQVNDKVVEPIDPLFLTPGFRWYDLDADRATALDPLTIAVKDRDTKEVIGHIGVRYSYMSPTFASIDKRKGAGGKNANERFSILKEYNGFIVARMGRVISVVRHSPLGTFVNYDRFVKIELDFDARLDELFNVPTAKQRVDVSDRVWELLREAGVEKALTQLRSMHKEDRSKIGNLRDAGKKGKRASEEAMEHTAELAPVIPLPVREKHDERGRQRLEKEAHQRAIVSGRSVEEAKAAIVAELGGKLYKVAMRSVPGGSFFDVEQLGGTKVLWLNTASRFFQEVHSGPKSTPEVRSALEVLLFCIGDRMLEGQDTLRSFYTHEIPEWSKKLEFALAQLAQTIESSSSDDIDEEADEESIAS
jgi:hypothetical protein